MTQKYNNAAIAVYVCVNHFDIYKKFIYSLYNRKNNIHQLNSIDIVITMPSALNR